MKFRVICTVLFLVACLALCTAAEGARFLPGSDAVVFVDGVNGSDENTGTDSAPVRTLNKAYASLAQAGGTVVIAGEVNAGEKAFVPDAVGGAVVITSLYGGVDYAESAGAKLVLAVNMALNNDTYFEYVHFSMQKSGAVISARHNNFGIGDGVTVTDDSGVEDFSYPLLIGGYNGPTEAFSVTNKSYTVEVRSGTWSKLYGGNRRNSTAQRVALLTGDIAVIIRGGTFLPSSGSNTALEVSGMNVCSGRIYLEISGGTFGGHVFAVSRLSSINETTVWTPDAEYTADVLVRISGGEFQKRFRLAQNDLKDTVLTYPPKGNATVEITGGSFADYVVGYGMMGDVVLRYDPKVIDLADTAGFAMHSTAIGPAKAETETASFVNPISEYPDPYVMEKDGYYYYCFSGNGINVAVHGNVPMGMLSTQYRKVFTSDMTDIAGAKKNYWAPEIHYFDAETVGAENAGWYIYFAADDGDGANHRMYVLRATDRENPMSDYEMLGKIAPPTDICAIDGTVMLIGGKMYFVWSGWNDGATTNTPHSQDIYIAPMSNPWTISGDRVRLSTPEYSWEKKGGNSVTAEGNIRPTVNEGPQVLQNGGTTHVIYSASGSWTRYYCYGALTLIGNDPMNASHWYKSATPVFESGNGMYGTGHGSFVKDMDGNWWMYYHANSSLTVPEGATWWSERQTYVKPFNFVEKTISGKKVSYPNFGTPAAHESTQKLTAIVTDYHAEGEHWYGRGAAEVLDGFPATVRRCYICGDTAVAYEESRFAESDTGALFAAVASRAGETPFTFLARTVEGTKTVARLPEAFDGAYVYALSGEYITSVTVETDARGVYILLPSVDSEAIVFADAPLVRYGDANGDGAYTLLDAIRILRGISSSVAVDRAAADMNGDLALTVADAMLALIKRLN